MRKSLRPPKTVFVSTVDLRELETRLARCIRQIKQGEEIVVTERGRPIALLMPIELVKRASSLGMRLGNLAAQGRVTLPTRKPLKRLRPVKIAGPPISRT